MGPATTKARVTRSPRSYEPLTDANLQRLRDLALERHSELAAQRPEWCDELLAACLVQGAARHRVHGDRGIKDIDILLLYPLPAGQRTNAFPFARGTVQRDFGQSEHGRELYEGADYDSPSVAKRIRTWERFAGRRVDLLARVTPPHPDGPAAAVQAWISANAGKNGSTPWHLARCPIVALWPDLGGVWWAGPSDDVAGVEKGAYVR